MLRSIFTSRCDYYASLRIDRRAISARDAQSCFLICETRGIVIPISDHRHTRSTMTTTGIRVDPRTDAATRTHTHIPSLPSAPDKLTRTKKSDETEAKAGKIRVVPRQLEQRPVDSLAYRDGGQRYATSGRIWLVNQRRIVRNEPPHSPEFNARTWTFARGRVVRVGY